MDNTLRRVLQAGHIKDSVLSFLVEEDIVDISTFYSIREKDIEISLAGQTFIGRTSGN